MEQEIYLGQKIAVLSRQIDRAIGKEVSKYGISGIQGKIIGFLFCESLKKGRDVFQKDIEETFGIRRSSVSNVLDKLEDSGYIVRKSCDKDARLKKIELTHKGKEMHELIHGSISKVEDILCNALSEAELNFFLDIVNRLSNVIEN